MASDTPLTGRERFERFVRMVKDDYEWESGAFQRAFYNSVLPSVLEAFVEDKHERERLAREFVHPQAPYTILSKPRRFGSALPDLATVSVPFQTTPDGMLVLFLGPRIETYSDGKETCFVRIDKTGPLPPCWLFKGVSRDYYEPVLVECVSLSGGRKCFSGLRPLWVDQAGVFSESGAEYQLVVDVCAAPHPESMLVQLKSIAPRYWRDYESSDEGSSGSDSDDSNHGFL